MVLQRIHAGFDSPICMCVCIPDGCRTIRKDGTIPGVHLSVFVESTGRNFGSRPEKGGWSVSGLVWCVGWGLVCTFCHENNLWFLIGCQTPEKIEFSTNCFLPPLHPPSPLPSPLPPRILLESVVVFHNKTGDSHWYLSLSLSLLMAPARKTAQVM